jgi:nucleotide-binding universal stress UspA family protein
MYQDILVPLDGSEAAEAALPYALELRRLSGGTLTLVRVVPAAIQPPALYSMTEPDAWFLRRRELQAEAELYLADVTTRAEVAAAQPWSQVICGDADEALLALIQEEPFDVLVMTTRSRRDPLRWMLGSVADYLVQRAPIPVLLVRQDGAA